MIKNKWTFRRAIGAVTVIALAAFALAGCGEEGSARPVRVNLDGGETMGMVRIVPGTFTMGQNHDMPSWAPAPERQVTLTRGFYMSVHPVTQDQFYAVMGANPSYFSGNPAEGETQGRRPVENVNWYHAIAFANRLSILQGLEPVYSIAGISNADADAWLFRNVPVDWDETWNAVTANWDASGFRLPTEAEWECVDKARKTAIMTTKCLASTLGMIS